MVEHIEHIDKLKIGYEEWDVYKESDTSYQYSHWPSSFCGEVSKERITVTFKNGKYEFNAESYFELYGSGDWSKWTDYREEVKEAVLADAMERITNEN